MPWWHTPPTLGGHFYALTACPSPRQEALLCPPGVSPPHRTGHFSAPAGWVPHRRAALLRALGMVRPPEGGTFVALSGPWCSGACLSPKIKESIGYRDAPQEQCSPGHASRGRADNRPSRPSTAATSGTRAPLQGPPVSGLADWSEVGQTAAVEYNRTIIAYHGCDTATAEQLLAGGSFQKSENKYDWLGEGIYFWEFGPDRALSRVPENHAATRNRRLLPAGSRIFISSREPPTSSLASFTSRTTSSWSA